MTFPELQSIVGMSDVKIKSSTLRFSELSVLAKKVAAMQRGKLTIVVCESMLNFDEIRALSDTGGTYVTLDMTEC